MSKPTILSQIAKIRNFEKGHRASRVLNTGFRFGILSTLADSPEGLTVPELALELMLYEPFLKIWCQTAYHFEVLDCDEKGRFKLQVFLDEILGLDLPFPFHPPGKENPLRMSRPNETDDPFSLYLRTGRVLPMDNLPEVSFSRCRATKSIFTIFQSMIFPRREDLESRLEKGCAYLDIGCGSGQLVLDFAQRFKKSNFVGVDPDTYGIEKADQSIDELGLDDRVSVENKGGEEIHFNHEFDLAGMVFTLHEILPEVRPDLLRKTFQSLKKGGRLLILDYPFPGRLEDFRNPRYEYGIIEQYFEAMSGIVHIPEKEQNELLSQAGFQTIDRMTVGEGGMLDFITAGK
jgi:ubiquinone/menaquinone biosynthesis C-methylase UbiE